MLNVNQYICHKKCHVLSFSAIYTHQFTDTHSQIYMIHLLQIFLILRDIKWITKVWEKFEVIEINHKHLLFAWTFKWWRNQYVRHENQKIDSQLTWLLFWNWKGQMFPALGAYNFPLTTRVIEFCMTNWKRATHGHNQFMADQYNSSMFA